MTPISCGCSSMPTVAEASAPEPNPAVCHPLPPVEATSGRPANSDAPFLQNKKKCRNRSKMHPAHAPSRHGSMYKGPSGWRCTGPFIMQVCLSRQAVVPSSSYSSLPHSLDPGQRELTSCYHPCAFRSCCPASPTPDTGWLGQTQLCWTIVPRFEMGCLIGGIIGT